MRACLDAYNHAFIDVCLHACVCACFEIGVQTYTHVCAYGWNGDRKMTRPARLRPAAAGSLRHMDVAATSPVPEKVLASPSWRVDLKVSLSCSSAE